MDPYKSKSKSKIKIEKEVFKNYIHELWNDLSKRSSSNQPEQGIPRSLFYAFLHLPLIISQRLFDISAKEHKDILTLSEFENCMTTLYLEDYYLYGDNYSTMKLIFDIYDFNGDGIISREDIEMIVQYIPYTNNEYDYTKKTNSKKETYDIIQSMIGNKESLSFEEFEKSSYIQKCKNDLCHFLFSFILDNNPFNNYCIKEYKKQISELSLKRVSNIDELFQRNRANTLYTDDLIKQGMLEKPCDISFNSFMTHRLSENYRNSTNYNPINNYSRNSNDYSRNSTDSFASMKSNTTTTTTTEMSLSNFARNSNPLHSFHLKNNQSNQILPRNRNTSFKEEEDYFCNSERRNNESIPNAYMNNNIQVINDFTEVLDFTSGSEDEIEFKEINKTESLPLHEGYLFKKSSRDSTVKKTFYKLIGKDFYFFKNAQYKKHQGMHYLIDVFIQMDIPPIYIGKTLYYPFSIAYSGKEKIYYTKDNNEREKWVNILKEASNTKGDIFDSYILKEDIANGKFGLIKKAINKKTNEEVAVKVLQKENLSEEDKVLIYSEIEVMKILDNMQNIIHLHSTYETEDSYYIVMEYCQGGSLLSYLESKNFNLSEAECKTILYNILTAISNMHSLGIIHRDIKIENILLKRPCDISRGIRVTDFGFSTPLGPTETKHEPYGTVTYAAPEVLMGHPYNSKVDIWSIGVLAFLLLDGSLPYNSESENLIEQIEEGEPCYHDMEMKVSKEGVDFVRTLLQKEEERRPSVDEALRHRWFQI